jgi:hypothetical protein
VSFTAITLCVASQRVFIVVVYFVVDSLQKLLVHPCINASCVEVVALIRYVCFYVSSQK